MFGIGFVFANALLAISIAVVNGWGSGDPLFVIRPLDALLTRGNEHQPGPEETGEDFKTAFLEFLNPSHLDNHFDELFQRPGRALFLNEHSCPRNKQSELEDRLKDRKWKASLPDLDPELQHQTACVGVMVRSVFKVSQLAPKTQAMTQLITNGRCDRYLSDLALG